MMKKRYLQQFENYTFRDLQVAAETWDHEPAFQNPSCNPDLGPTSFQNGRRETGANKGLRINSFEEKNMSPLPSSRGTPRCSRILGSSACTFPILALLLVLNPS